MAKINHHYLKLRGPYSYEKKGLDLGGWGEACPFRADCSDVLEIFSIDNRVAIQDPIDPRVVDIYVMKGRTKQILKAGG